MLLETVNTLSSSDKIAGISLFVSLLTFLFTIFTFFRYDRKQKNLDAKLKNYELQEIELKAISEKQAQVKANIIKGDRGKRTVKIFNSGKAIARNIRLEFEPQNDFSFLFDKEKFPFEFLNPQEGTDYSFQVVKEYPRQIRIILFWDDDFGNDRSYEQILTL
ncbi:hypothetical protein HZP81_08325 [Elizabethkingia anophelis]|nr:hypothetical protein [Elizabethkingia anophelis]